MDILEILKVIVYGLVEGYTEWLPISSTGHLILVEELIPLSQPESFMTVFRVVIQLGAILAVVVMFWNKLWPFFMVGKRSFMEDDEEAVGPVGVRISTLALWIKIVIACLPAAIVGIPLDDFLDEHLYNAFVVALMLIVYGVIFIWIERRNEGVNFPVDRLSRIDIRTALYIGLFQCLSLIPYRLFFTCQQIIIHEISHKIQGKQADGPAQVDDRAHGVIETDCVHKGIPVLLCQIPEGVHGFGFCVEALDDPDAGKILMHECI